MSITTNSKHRNRINFGPKVICRYDLLSAIWSVDTPWPLQVSYGQNSFSGDKPGNTQDPHELVDWAVYEEFGPWLI